MNFCAIVFVSLVSSTSAQVCSPIGQLCTRTTDCCKGCCEAHTCVDRGFPCSGDLTSQPGFNSCTNHFCPQGQFCILVEVCPPENPCPRHPTCRKSDSLNNDSEWQYRNSFDKPCAGPVHFYFTVTFLILTLFGSVFM